MVLDGALLHSSSGSGGRWAAADEEGLLPAPLTDPLALLPLHGRLGALEEGDATGAPPAVPGHGVSGGGGRGGNNSCPGSGQQGQEHIAKLQAQLTEARAAARQWQALHGELHRFCCEQLLAGGAGGSSRAAGSGGS